ncbi:MAG: CHASE3 domain-containing protein, partial [Polyangiaceae bacterium]
MPLTLRNAIVAAVGFVLAMVACLALSVRLAHSKADIVHATLVKLAVVQLRFDLVQAGSASTAYAITGRQDRLEVYRAASTSLHENVEKVRSLTRQDPVQQKALVTLDAGIANRERELKATIDMRDSEGRAAAVDLVAQQIAARTFENRALILGMLAEEDLLLDLHRARVSRQTIEGIVAVSFASLCFGFLFMFGWNVRRADAQARLMGKVRRSKLEAENTALSERAKVSEFQERFIGVLGHDLRNPLGALAMGIDLLRSEVPDEQMTLDRMRSSAQRMARMIDQLLDLTRTRLGGGIELTRQEVDLKKLTTDIVDELRAQTPEAVIAIEADGDLLGHWDPDRLAQVISNLVSNALHHGDPFKPIRVSLEGHGAEVLFRVHTEGPSIPLALQNVLFDPFRRGERQSN